MAFIVDFGSLYYVIILFYIVTQILSKPNFVELQWDTRKTYFSAFWNNNGILDYEF